MKKLLLSIAVLFAATISFAQGRTYVHGYTRSNGTYVQGHYRTLPNDTRNDNWSTIGNVNPYTGIEGTKPRDLDYYPTYSNYSSRTSIYYELPSTSSYNNYTTPRVNIQGIRYTSSSLPSVSALDILNNNSIYISSPKIISSSYWPY